MKTFSEWRQTCKEDLHNTINKLSVMFNEKFEPNQKLVSGILDAIYICEDDDAMVELSTQLSLELDKFNMVVEAAIAQVNEQSLNEKIDNVVRWLANNGVNPDSGFAPNAKRRYDMIIKKLNETDEK